MADLKLTQIAIIPARGGSKRLPRKNILPVNGKPMIYYPIQSAIKSGLFDEVIVSTEDEEIAGIAKKFGASVSIRSEDLAQDSSTVVQVCDELLARKKYQGVETFCCIYPTAIFLAPEDLKGAREMLTEDPPVSCVMGVSQYNYHPVQALKKSGGYLKSMWPEFNSRQSQSYPQLVVSNGTMYWARKEKFLNDKSFYGEHLVGYDLPEAHAIDIDNADDYERAKKIAATRL